MKNSLTLLIASEAKQSPADMGIASPPAAARNVTVENFYRNGRNFLPQQRWRWVEALLLMILLQKGKNRTTKTRGHEHNEKGTL